MSASRAIVTLTIGDEYVERWHRLCEANWRDYADRHGYDLICLDEPLDDSDRARDRSPSWQKLIVLEQKALADYERVVWVDADILFGHDAPTVADGFPAELLGAVDELDLPTPAVRKFIHPDPMPDWYAAGGLPGSFEHVVQGGLLVLSPPNHRELLRGIYDQYEDPGPGLLMEMRPLSYELLRAERVSWLDPRFNVPWWVFKAHRFPFLIAHPRHPRAAEAIAQGLREVYGLHFAGGRRGEVDRALESEDRRLAANRARPPRRARSRSSVLLTIFNRPDTTRRVVEAMREARPPQLLVVADAPRPSVAGEEALCEQARGVIDEVDWDCEVVTNYADEHLGLTRRIETGFDWAFGIAPEAIVLEDDCVPDPTFFDFCDQLLERYRDVDEVMSIGGSNFQFDRPASSDSYYVSRFHHSGAWASWRRAWQHYDPEMSRWPDLRDSGWLDEATVDAPHANAFWSHTFERVYREGHAWDAAWLFSTWVQGGLHLVPNVNLVTNVGYREDGTHTRIEHRGLFNDLPTEPISFPLRHPSRLVPNPAADRFIESVMFSGLVDRVFERLRHTRNRPVAPVEP